MKQNIFKKILITGIAAAVMLCPAFAFATDTNTDQSINEDAIQETIADGGTADPHGEVGSYWTFKKSSETSDLISSKTQKMSACCGKGLTPLVTITRTFSASFSSGFPAAVKSQVLSSCSASVGVSLTNSQTYTAEKNTKSGKESHIVFIPRYVKVSGTAYHRSTLGEVISKKPVSASYPKKYQGFADGSFRLEYHTAGKCNR